MDVSGGILANLDAGNPCRHDEIRLFMFVGERKIMNHFVANRLFIFVTLALRIRLQSW
jgi:hypothetical protein